MDYLPLFIDLRDRAVLVAGGDAPAARRVDLLLRAGAVVRVVAPSPAPEIEALASSGRIRLERRPFAPADVAGAAAVFGTSGDAETDAAVAAAARVANIPVNVVDRADLSTVIMPAIVDRDPVLIAISSGGTAPVLARRLRAQIEALVPARLGSLARFAQHFRAAARAVLATATLRRRFWEQVFASPIAEAVLIGHEPAARARMLRLLNGTHGEPGVVYLVGTGPGDPDLLTLRALQLMQQADVVVYDERIGPEILDRVRRDAERIYVGPSNGRRGLSRDEINALLLLEAPAGRRVLHLVFGRGGEDAEFLKRHDIDVIAVPGIAAAPSHAQAGRAVSW